MRVLTSEIEEPWSTWSAAAYVLVAGALVVRTGEPAAYVLAACLTVLAIGTALMHAGWTRRRGTLDHAGMQATLCALATLAVGGPWWLALVGAAGAALALEVWLQVPVRPLMGVWLYVIICGGIVSGAWLPLGLGLGLLALAWGWWWVRGDRAHAMWHVFSAAGFYALHGLAS